LGIDPNRQTAKTRSLKKCKAEVVVEEAVVVEVVGVALGRLPAAKMGGGSAETDEAADGETNPSQDSRPLATGGPEPHD
jgi:hypothetical protein